MSFKNNEISAENWNIARFKQADLLSFISLGASPDANKADQASYIFFVIVSDLEYNEISEQCFLSLEEAISSINTRFYDWELTFLGNKSGGGCDSCAAH